MYRKLEEWKRKLNPVYKFQRWKASRVELLRELDKLRKETARMQQKLIALQRAKDQAETHAEDRRKEKEAMREKMRVQKLAFAARELEFEQLRAKITELRNEVEGLKARKRH